MMCEIAEVEKDSAGIALWVDYPFRLVSWWDMAKFDGSTFCLICSHLRGMGEQWEQDRNVVIGEEGLKRITGDLQFARKHCLDAGIENAAAYIDEHLPLLTAEVTYGYVLQIFGNVSFQIRSEMKRVKFLTVDRPKFYGDAPLFDPVVTDIFQQLTYDVVEAGNCLALNRTTACVFHLMRIMEFGVQRFGDKLRVPLVNESVWQKIMDQINKKIGDMPEKPASRKRKKEAYADVAGHLYNVKVAWRNPVMHPKRTYTPEEAERLFITVGDFMVVLVTLLKPKTVAALKTEEVSYASATGAALGILTAAAGATTDGETK